MFKTQIKIWNKKIGRIAAKKEKSDDNNPDNNLYPNDNPYVIQPIRLQLQLCKMVRLLAAPAPQHWFVRWMSTTMFDSLILYIEKGLYWIDSAT
jgi:hypothetical protein